ncbi:hypothetical protein V6R21_04875, partial [Limibacter armeniacum]|uniref:hypothetical protein n=1 Tax=Limibacter armeniacum TaxID=466084 RepID=UPI002FE588FB
MKEESKKSIYMANHIVLSEFNTTVKSRRILYYVISELRPVVNDIDNSLGQIGKLKFDIPNSVISPSGKHDEIEAAVNDIQRRQMKIPIKRKNPKGELVDTTKSIVPFYDIEYDRNVD